MPTLDITDYQANLIVAAIAEKVFKGNLHNDIAFDLAQKLGRLDEYGFRLEQLQKDAARQNSEWSKQRYTEVLTAGGHRARVYARAMLDNAYGEAHGAIYMESYVDQAGWSRTAWGKDGKSLSHASLDIPAQYVKGDY